MCWFCVFRLKSSIFSLKQKHALRKIRKTRTRLRTKIYEFSANGNNYVAPFQFGKRLPRRLSAPRNNIAVLRHFDRSGAEKSFKTLLYHCEERAQASDATISKPCVTATKCEPRSRPLFCDTAFCLVFSLSSFRRLPFGFATGYRCRTEFYANRVRSKTYATARY